MDEIKYLILVQEAKAPLLKNKQTKPRHWWLMPIILPTEEAEIRRIEV
jgi:hypothetical protein